MLKRVTGTGSRFILAWGGGQAERSVPSGSEKENLSHFSCLQCEFDVVVRFFRSPCKVYHTLTKGTTGRDNLAGEVQDTNQGLEFPKCCVGSILTPDYSERKAGTPEFVQLCHRGVLPPWQNYLE